jgi:GH15 family glucan-1,4-alpha-glucosidase
LIGDTHTAALVGRDGSIDWLCFPRFDSAACFAALLGEEKHGFWRLSPVDEIRSLRRHYRPDTLVLETEFETTNGGCVRLIDCMPPRTDHPHVIRLVEGVQGNVRMRMCLVIRFEYGSIVPWIRKRAEPGEFRAIAGPDAIVLRSHIETRGENLATVAEFEVAAGEKIPFVLSWHFSHQPPPPAIDAEGQIASTEKWWRDWTARSKGVDGKWADAVKRSLITLKALTYAPSGGIVAAPTTSLPEELGGHRNWDYRFCWLRDAAFTLDAFIGAGYLEEASAWRDWLLRAVAGDPAELQILYGVLGERRLPEYELADLPGYEGSKPVRVGNAAAGQYQLDIYGEVVDTLFRARSVGLADGPDGIDWSVPKKLLNFLESNWFKPDEGIWEVRGPRQQFTYSKVMAWVAVDRVIRLAERFHLPADLTKWKSMRQAIHHDVCEKGFNPNIQAFTQCYGSTKLDASILRLPLVGFLKSEDPRIGSTIKAVERELLSDGFVRRYITDSSGSIDGFPDGEGAFLPCTFWLADNYHLIGRHEEACDILERLLSLRNDLGLLSEEYDSRNRRLVGNFPQAFSHVALVNTALRLNARLEGK